MFRGVRQLLTGGEVMSPVHVQRALAAAPALTLFNAYGPTENATIASLHRVDAESLDGITSIPIGRPLLNTRIYVLDARKQLVPIGEEGEVWIGGDGVAVGYLDDPALTADRFVDDPFVESPGARMYRSGDVGRWRDDAALEFVRRLDDQIKLRGYRIEPAEIEAALTQHPAIQRSVVVAFERPSTGRTLMAFLVLARGVTPSERDALLDDGLRSFLSARLPDYMVPSLWSAADTLPLLASGKADRRQLAAMAATSVRQLHQTVFLPHSTVEARVAEIWRSLLNIESVGRTDNFFDLGGHSLLALQAVSRIQAAFQVDFTLRAFFLNATVAAVGAAVEQLLSAQPSAVVAMTRVPRHHPLPLSYSQQRLWFLQRWYGDVGVYNVPSAFMLDGVVDVDRLRRALQALVDRHESLRTVFPLVDGAPMQRVLDHLEVPFEVIDLSHLDGVAAEAAAGADVTDDSTRPFDLENGPLIRAAIFRLPRRDRCCR